MEKVLDSLIPKREYKAGESYTSEIVDIDDSITYIGYILHRYPLNKHTKETIVEISSRISIDGVWHKSRGFVANGGQLYRLQGMPSEHSMIRGPLELGINRKIEVTVTTNADVIIDFDLDLLER